jgi:CHASE2 domain-containing sensor protein
MDDAGFERLGHTHFEIWPREIMAEFIDRARELGAKRIVFDLFFKELRDPTVDEKLREAFASMPVSIIGVVETRRNSLGGKNTYVVKPNSFFSSAAKQIGGANLTLSLNLLQQNTVVRLFAREFEKGIPPIYQTAFPGRDFTQGPGRYDFINYYGPAGSIPSIPLFDFIDKKVRKKSVEDKTLFVGHALEYRQSKDSFSTPMEGLPILGITNGNGTLHGVEIHTTQALNVIDQNWISRYDPAFENKYFIFTLGILVIMPLAAYGQKEFFVFFWRFLISFFLVSLWCAYSYLKFLENVYLPFFSLLTIGFPLFAGLGALYTYRDNRKFKEMMKGFLGDSISTE